MQYKILLSGQIHHSQEESYNLKRLKATAVAIWGCINKIEIEYLLFVTKLTIHLFCFSMQGWRFCVFLRDYSHDESYVLQSIGI